MKSDIGLREISAKFANLRRDLSFGSEVDCQRDKFLVSVYGYCVSAEAVLGIDRYDSRKNIDEKSRRTTVMSLSRVTHGTRVSMALWRVDLTR